MQNVLLLMVWGLWAVLNTLQKHPALCLVIKSSLSEDDCTKLVRLIITLEIRKHDTEYKDTSPRWQQCSCTLHTHLVMQMAHTEHILQTDASVSHIQVSCSLKKKSLFKQLSRLCNCKQNKNPNSRRKSIVKQKTPGFHMAHLKDIQFSCNNI